MQLEQFTPPEAKYKSILLFGMPGSGKGTQGLILGQLPGMVHVSCGEIFRKLPRGGMLGKEVMAFTSQGNLVPDDLTVRIWSRHLKILELQEFFLPEKHVLILDGLPRNLDQAKALADIGRFEGERMLLLKVCMDEAAAAAKVVPAVLPDKLPEALRGQLGQLREDQLQAVGCTKDQVQDIVSKMAILLAMDASGSGHLTSIDMPYRGSTDDSYVGQAVPESLRSRWSLLKPSEFQELHITSGLVLLQNRVQYSKSGLNSGPL